MERVLGIGGVFFTASNPQKLATWYQEKLGIPVDAEQTFATLRSSAAGEQTVWSAFPIDTEYFGADGRTLMINYRVRNLVAMLTQLRAAGTPVDDRIEDSEFGRFGWATDPEGNRFELWEPPQTPRRHE